MAHFKTMFVFVISFLLSLIGLTTTAHASEIHEVMDVYASDGPSIPDAHYSENAWIYTREDGTTGYEQVFYQYVDSSTTPATINEIRLTSTRYNKSLPKWGGQPSSLYFYPTYGSTTRRQCEGMQLYYFLGDDNEDGNTELYVSCFDNFMGGGAPSTIFTAKLTEWDSTSTYDITDYDVTRDDSSYLYITATERYNAYPVVFVTADGDIHLLQHRGDLIYGDVSNIDYDAVVHDNDDPTGLFKWGAVNRATQSKFSSYQAPRFDEHGYNITFLGIPEAATDGLYQVGLMWTTGKKEYQVTNYARTITNPRFLGSITDTSGIGAVTELFFEFGEDSATSQKGQLVHMKVAVSVLGPSTWCDTSFIMTDNIHSRQKLETRYIDAKQNAGNIQMNYELVQDDDYRDIYIADVMLAPCQGTMTNSAPASATITTPNLAFTFSEIQLTCQNDNVGVKILPSIFFDATFTSGVFSLNKGFTDVVFLREFVDGSGSYLAHIYDVENAIDTLSGCESCYENADGSAIDDDNTYLDDDHIKDSCETNLPCSAVFLTAEPTGDYDSDGLVNNEDNCPCSYNPTQNDSDSDGVGDVYNTENGCDNCPGVANPADLDVNGDGKTGETTHSDGYLDGDVRQTDTDSDGYGDACEEVVDECGDNDRDADGINDYCDNCLYTYNPSQDDTNGDGAGDACTTIVVDVYPCVEGNTDYLYDTDNDGSNDSCTETPDYPCEEGNLNYLYDTDGDGTKDSCTSSADYPCEEGNLNYLYDTDSDGTKDSCRPCSGNTFYAYDLTGDGENDSCLPCAGNQDYLYDTNADGVNDSCVDPQVIEPIGGGYNMRGAMCSLSPGAADLSTLSLILAGLCPLALSRFRRRK